MSVIEEYAFIAPIGALVTAGLAVIMNGRHWILGMLAGEYVFLAWFAALILPIPVAAVSLAAGWMACTMLALTVARMGREEKMAEGGGFLARQVFRLIAVVLAGLAAWGIVGTGWEVLPGLSWEATAGAGLFLTTGLLHVGLAERPLRVGVGLLTAMCGFQVAYMTIEQSLAVMALLGGIHLGIAITISYLLVGIRERAEGPKAS